MIDMKKLPEGPFSYLITAQRGAHEGSGHVYIIDANERKIASVWGKPEEKLALAELIIDARARVVP